MENKVSRIFFCIIIVAVFFLPSFIFADSEGQQKIFFVDPLYDVNSRTQIEATLQKISNKAYFYLEKIWYENLTPEKKKDVLSNLKILAEEFDNKVYPQLTSFYGPEWNLGIDDDSHITILFHQMKNEAAGYFNNGDEYEKIQNPNSNEREMIYLNAKNIFYEIIKSYISHEFTHLITFNQKERLKGVEEEIWLNEARADFTSTLLNYDDGEFEDTNLKQRVRAFVEGPSDSLPEWQSQKKDYGVANLFIQYLVDYYGKEILSASMKSSKIGIPSLNEALAGRNSSKTFEEIFSDWAITVFLNDCNFGNLYCYKNQNLNNLKITPSLLFLPSTQKTSISLDYAVKPWSANWYRIIGGQGELKVKFSGAIGANFKIPFVLCQNSSQCKVDFFNLKNEVGEIVLSDFGKTWTSLTIIPFAQPKITGFSNNEPLFNFSLSASIEAKNEEKLIEELKAIIASLQQQIALVQAKISAILWQKGGSCVKLTKNLYFGIKDFEVSCLQKFLASQGTDIYPQAIISGFFGSLTKAAVIKFQEKYSSEILEPIGLKQGNGIVDFLTLEKINKLLSPR